MLRVIKHRSGISLMPILLVLLSFTIFVSCGGGVKPPPELEGSDRKIIPELVFVKGSDYISVELENGNNQDLDNFIFKIDGQEIEFIRNKYYPCQDGKITIYWKEPDGFKLKNVTPYEELKLNFSKPNGNALCQDDFWIKNIDLANDCKFEILSNLDQKQGVDLYYSIHGKDGKYHDRNKFDRTKNYIFNIWGYCKYANGEESPKRPFWRNGDNAGFSLGLNDTTKAKLVRVLNYLGENLGKRDAIIQYNDLVKSGVLPSDSDMMIDGNKLNPVDFINRVMTAYANSKVNQDRPAYRFKVKQNGADSKGDSCNVKVTVKITEI